VDGVSPIGWFCLLPPFLTIGLAVTTRRVVLSLLIGIGVAVALMLPTPAAFTQSSGEPFSWMAYAVHAAQRFVFDLAEGHLWQALIDEDHLRVFVFTSLLGMQVSLIHRSGGMQAIVRWAVPLAKTRRGGQLLTWMLGLVIFIDDYANTLLLGSTMRPLTDRLRISREKLAFLVDSTAAPVSGLALVSTWVATEISAMQVGFADAGIEIGADTFGIFIQTIPSRFYVIYMLVFVFLCGLMCRDFGPMLSAEQKAVAEPLDRQKPDRSATPVPLRARNALVPIGVTVSVAVWLLALTGYTALGDQPVSDSSLQAWGEIIGQGNSYVALVYGALAGLLVLVVMVVSQRSLDKLEVRTSLFDGFKHVLPAMVILWLAWTLSTLTGSEHMNTGEYVARAVSQWDVSAGLFPTLLFLLASAMAFSTGTSWGTMAILMPMAVPLVYGVLSDQLASPPAPNHFVLLASIGSVLAGAIFGDHCSPISDTTILSSQASDCNHISHVRTQMPYALVVGAIAIFVGTLPAGFGVSSWILLPLGIVAMVAVLLIWGRNAQSPN
jgi:Na+/H+ antiporter NhaC